MVLTIGVLTNRQGTDLNSRTLCKYWLGCSCFRAERVISGLGLLQLLVVLEIVLGSLANFHPYSRPLCLATQVSIIEDSACRVRIILTCLLNTVYPTTIPIHHLGWSLSVYKDTRVIWDCGYIMEHGVWVFRAAAGGSILVLVHWEDDMNYVLCV